MDKNGDNYHLTGTMGSIKNYFNQPHLKATAVAVAFFFAAHSYNNDNDNLMRLPLDAAICVVFSEFSRQLKKDLLRSYNIGGKYFFDTKPNKILPLSPNVQFELMVRKEISTSNIKSSSFIASVLTAVSLTGEASLQFPVLYTTVFIGNSAAEYWRADQGLKGNWSVSDKKQEKKKKEQKAPAAKLQPI